MYIASPDPGVYNLISDFDIGKPGTANIGTKRGIYSMGKKVKNPDDPMSKLDKYDGMPGPGAYTSKLMTIGHSGPMYNLQGRSHNVNGKLTYFLFSFCLHFLDPINLAIKKNNPPPGYYGQGIEINKYGKYALSTISNSKAANWSPSKSRFDERRRTETPGPGVYNPSDNINGKFVLSGTINHGTSIMRPAPKLKRFKS